MQHGRGQEPDLFHREMRWLSGEQIPPLSAKTSADDCERPHANSGRLLYARASWTASQATDPGWPPERQHWAATYGDVPSDSHDVLGRPTMLRTGVVPPAVPSRFHNLADAPLPA